MRPDYKLIYTDILKRKFPHKESKCQKILEKESISNLDIINLNQIIFEIPDRETAHFNGQHRSYKTADIIRILDYQKKHQLNNTKLSLHFGISRNTVIKWKKIFLQDSSAAA